MLSGNLLRFQILHQGRKIGMPRKKAAPTSDGSSVPAKKLRIDTGASDAPVRRSQRTKSQEEPIVLSAVSSSLYAPHSLVLYTHCVSRHMTH